MKLKKHRYLAPEPGDTAGTGTAAPVETPAAEAAPAETTDVVKIESGDENASKITALLDGIGKPEGEKAADAEPKPAVAAPETTEPKPAAKPEAKDDDLAPPEGANEKTMGRWAKLAERAKAVPELEKRATEAETALSSVRELVAQSGLAQDEFRGMLEMGRLFKSNDPNDLKTALQQIEGLRTDLATRLGIDAPGVDPLAKHADLLADVEGMTISRERALEIAKLRDKAARADEQGRSQQEMTQYQETVKSAAASMDAALAQRAATPGHAEKLAFITRQLSDPARMQQFVTTYQPNQWQAAVLMMYDAYTPPAAPAPPAVQPLRPGNVATGVRQIGSKPITAEESVEHAWAAAGL